MRQKCTQCTAIIPVDALFCEGCGYPIKPPPPLTIPHLKVPHPHLAGLLPVGGLLLLSGGALLLALTGTLFNGGGGWWAATIIITLFLLLFGLIFVVMVLLGWRTQAQTRAFLRSDRPLFGWQYDAQSWRQIQEAQWDESKGDWKVQLGCLTLLMALVGLLTGGMVGFDDSVLTAVAYAAAGCTGAAVIGGLIATAVAGGNWLASYLLYRQPPGGVVLGYNEFYAQNDYFCASGTVQFIEKATLQREKGQLYLIIDAQLKPKPRAPKEGTWRILVPAPAEKEMVARLSELY